MEQLHELFESNKTWAANMRQHDPDFFLKLSGQQAPQYLWIGCSDSRVPANEIVGLLPGELFVHRNVANVVVHSDLNCLSVIQFAIELLRVKHIIVCGHYGCSGINMVLRGNRVGLADNWLRHIYDVQQKHRESLETLASDDERVDRLCELNVIEQVINVSETTVVQDAWARGQELTVHGWIYGLKDGHLQNLHMSVSDPHKLLSTYREALDRR